MSSPEPAPGPAPTYRLVAGDLKGGLSILDFPLDDTAGPLDPTKAAGVTPVRLVLRTSGHTAEHGQQPEGKPGAIQVLVRGSVHGRSVGIACRRDGRVDVFIVRSEAEAGTVTSPGATPSNPRPAPVLLAFHASSFRVNQTRWIAAAAAGAEVWMMASNGQLWMARFDHATEDKDVRVDVQSLTLAAPSHPLMASTFLEQNGRISHVAFGGQDVPLTIVHLPDVFIPASQAEDDASMATSSPRPPSQTEARNGRKRGRPNGRASAARWPGQVFQAKRLPVDTLRMERKPNLTALAFLPPAEPLPVDETTNIVPGTLVLAGTRTGLLRVYDPNPLAVSLDTDDSDEEPQAKKPKTTPTPSRPEPVVYGYHIAEFALLGGAGAKLDAPEFHRAFPPNHSGATAGSLPQEQQVKQVAKAGSRSILAHGSRTLATLGAGKMRPAVRSITVVATSPGFVYVSDAETGVYLIDWSAGKVVSRIQGPTGTITSMLPLPAPSKDVSKSKTPMARMVSVSQDKLVRLHHVPLPCHIERGIGPKSSNIPSLPLARVVAQAFVQSATPWCAFWDGILPSFPVREDDGDDGLDAMETVGQGH